MTRASSLFVPCLLVLLAGACRSSTGVQDLAYQDAATQNPIQMPELPPIPGLGEGDFDWIKLTSGEWLKGEIDALYRGTLEFDSDELGDLRLDWDDVAEVYTTRPFTLLMEDRTTVKGYLRIDKERVFVDDKEMVHGFARKDLQRLVPGEPGEANYWSGKLKVGTIVRSGNTNQTDATVSIGAKRRTAGSRLDLAFDSVYSRVESVDNADNQRLFGQWDIFLTSRLYVTPLGVEFYRDPIANIDLRTSPYAGVGYTLIDRNTLEWTGLLGAGYRKTTFVSVQPGEDQTSTTGNIIASTGLHSDLTKKIELTASYNAFIGVDDVEDTNQDASIGFSIDIWGDLDLDVTFSWIRVGQPAEDADGNTPKKDDFRFDTGISWSF